MANHKIYVYGTLRPDKAEADQLEKVTGTMYDLGAFPGLVIEGQSVQRVVSCEVIEADDDELAGLDRYEGYNPDDPEGSLYLRKAFRDGWIYVYNQPYEGRPVVECGDWVLYKELKPQLA